MSPTALSEVASPAEDLPVAVVADDLLAGGVGHHREGDLLEGGGRDPAGAVGIAERIGTVEETPAGESDVVPPDVVVRRGQAEGSVHVYVYLTLHPQQGYVHLAGLALVVLVYLDLIHGVLHGQVGLAAGAVGVFPQDDPETAGLYELEREWDDPVRADGVLRM